MPDQGRIITKPAEDGTNQIVDFLFYDKYGHEISGIYEGAMEVIKASQSLPQPTQASLTSPPSRLLRSSQCPRLRSTSGS